MHGSSHRQHEADDRLKPVTLACLHCRYEHGRHWQSDPVSQIVARSIGTPPVRSLPLSHIEEHRIANYLGKSKSIRKPHRRFATLPDSLSNNFRHRADSHFGYPERLLAVAKT